MDATSQIRTGLLTASLVWDGHDVTIPPEMGEPTGDQMVGRPAERLTEICGRVCYDSCGKGRPSFDGPCKVCRGTGQGQQLCASTMNEPPKYEPCRKCNGSGAIQGYHSHILEVGHLSVAEHYNFTTTFSDYTAKEVVLACINRPGVFVFESEPGSGVRITTNLRSIIEWDDWSFDFNRGYATVIGDALKMAAFSLAPNIMKQSLPSADRQRNAARFRTVPPAHDEECWISLYMAGSRGFSHEQCRHGNRTAISMRSTRYIDESESNWVKHPLLLAYIQNHLENGHDDVMSLVRGCDAVEDAARDLYNKLVASLQEWLTTNGADKSVARKQARGAARGYLGNGLGTELIFSASVAQWRRMIRQRASIHADAEIRMVFGYVLQALMASRYRDRFEDLTIERSPDGIGFVAAEKVAS